MAPHDPRDHEDAVRELAAAYGVAVDYWDWQGEHVLVAVDTMVAVLAALGVDASSEDAARAALGAIADEAWRRMLPPVLVTRQGWRTTFDVHVPEGWPVDVWVELETGEHRGGVDQHDNWDPPRTVGGELVGEATFAIPGDLPLGVPLGARPQRRPAGADEPGRHAALGRHCPCGWGSAASGGSPPSSTACGRPARGGPATSPT